MTDNTQGSDRLSDSDNQSIKQQIRIQKYREYQEKWFEAFYLLGGKRSKDHKMGGLRFYVEGKA